MEDLKQIQEFFSKPLEENTFKKGDKVTYLGNPGEITFVGKDQMDRTYYSVSYDKGNGKTKASNLYNKDGEIKAINEMDMNDPVMMKMRAAKDKLAKMRAANAGDDGNDKFFDNAKKIAFLKKERERLMRDMEQEAEPEGGPIADEYGSKLNRIDAAISKLSGRKEMTYDQAIAEGEGKMPTQDQVDRFFELTQNETHYLNSKPVAGQEGTFNLMPIEPWDEYDLSNWNSLVRKAKQRMLGEMKIGDKVTFKSGGGEMEIIDVRDMFASDLKAYRVKNTDGETFEYSEDQLQLAENKLLKQSKLSSAEYQKAKKLKDFNKDDYKWNPGESLYIKLNESIAQTLAETIKLGEGVIEEELCPKGKAYIKRRKAAGEKSSAYLSGRAVKVCKGQMSGKAKKKIKEEMSKVNEFMGYKVGDDFYYVPSTQGETRYYKILDITKDTIKLQNYDYVRNGPDKRGDKSLISAIIFAKNVEHKSIAPYDRGDLSDY